MSASSRRGTRKALLMTVLGCLLSRVVRAEISLQLAQSHVFTAPSKTWSTADDGTTLEENDPQLELHLVGLRKALAIVEFGDVSAPVNPKLSITNNDTVTPVVIDLEPPSELPPTYGDVNSTDAADGVPYSTTTYSAKIPAELVKPILNIKVVHGDGEKTWSDIPVGAPTRLELVGLGMYLFGADPSTTVEKVWDGNQMVVDNSKPINIDKLKMTDLEQQEFMVRLPISSLKFELHPAKYFKSPYLVRGPRSGREAFRGNQRNDFAPDLPFNLLDSTLSIVQSIKDASGDGHMASQYYGLVVQHDENGEWISTGGGWGGGMNGVGLHRWDDIMIHELGHGFNIPHVGDSYPKKYPYERGSIKGSGWAYDEFKDKFYDVYRKVNIIKHEDFSDYNYNEGITNVIKDENGKFSEVKCHANGNCNVGSEFVAASDAADNFYKQDVMQNGNKDLGMTYGLFSDFNAAKIQRVFEGTSLQHPRNGPYQRDVTPAGGLAVWDPATHKYVDQELNFDIFPVESDPGKKFWYWDKYQVRHQTADAAFVLAVLTLSCIELSCGQGSSAMATSNIKAGSALTQIYPPMEYTGKTRFFLDLDDTSQLDMHHLVNAENKRKQWQPDIETKMYCDFGCDWFVSFTFADGTNARIISPKGFREWRRGADPFPARVMEPTNKHSFLEFAVAAPGSDPIRIDLFFLPLAYEGIHARVPQLITSWTKADGEVVPGDWAPETPALAHTLTYELKMPIPSAIDRCEVKPVYSFHRAVERAVFKSVVESTSKDLPPFTRVKLLCVCDSPTCPDRCGRGSFTSDGKPTDILPDWPDPEPVVSKTALDGPAVDKKQPHCCSFSKFDGDSTCTEGTHQSELTRIDYAPGVYYYVNDDGNPMKNVDAKTVTFNLKSLTLDEAIHMCRNDANLGGCGMVHREEEHASKRVYFVDRSCMSPCYKYDTWSNTKSQIAYHVDFDVNPWSTPPSERADAGAEMALKLEVHVPSVELSAVVEAHLSASGNTLSTISNRLAEDTDFTRFLPWTFPNDGSGLKHGYLRQATPSPPTPPTQPPAAKPPVNKSPPAEAAAKPPVNKSPPGGSGSKSDSKSEENQKQKDKAGRTRDSMLQGITDKRQKKKAELLANAAISGKKMRELKIPKLAAASVDGACYMAYSQANLDTNLGACVATLVSLRRRLAASSGSSASNTYEVEIIFTEDELDAAALENAVSALTASGIEGVASDDSIDPIAELATVPGVDTATLDTFKKDVEEINPASPENDETLVPDGVSGAGVGGPSRWSALVIMAVAAAIFA